MKHFLSPGSAVRLGSAVSVVAALTLAGLPQDKPSAKPALPVTVFLVRHAEAEPETDEKPDRLLTAAGKRRAAALQRLLGHAGIQHVFSSDYPRTRSTVTPIAKAAGVDIQLISPRSTRQQVTALRALPPGSVALVAGHSNTLPKLIKALGGKAKSLTRRGWLPDEVHDRLFIVTLPAGKSADKAADRAAAVQTIELRYGDEG